MPYGAYLIVAATRSAGISVRFLDLCFSENPSADLCNELVRHHPDIVGFSIRNIDSAAMLRPDFFLEEAKELIEKTRQMGFITVVGGAGFSVMPQPAFSYLNPDYGVVGEGETIFPKLVKALSFNEDPYAIPGVIGQKKLQPKTVEPLQLTGFPGFLPSAINELDTRYFTYCQDTPMGKIVGKASIQTKRGCPFHCIYCSHPNIEGKLLRFYPPEAIAAEIKVLHDKHGISEFEIVDSVFNYPIDFAKAVCREIQKLKLKISWTCTCNPAFLTQSLLDLMQKAGCNRIEFGTESGSDKVLKLLRKSFKAKDVASASIMCREAGVEFAHFLLIGSPGEDQATLTETLELMESVNPTNVLIMVGLRIYPETELEIISKKYAQASQDLIKPSFFFSPDLCANDLEVLDFYTSQHKNWYVFGSFGKPVKQLINSLPEWQENKMLSENKA